MSVGKGNPRGILNCRVEGEKAHITLNYEPRLIGHLFKEKVRILRNCLEFNMFTLRWVNQHKHWITHSGVTRHLTDDNECLKDLDVRFVFHRPLEKPHQIILRRALLGIFRQVLDEDMARRRALHSSVIGAARRLLVRQGWKVRNEFELTFETFVRSRGYRTKILGRIDLVAEKDGVDPIAFEFDNTNVLKFRSIEKLMQFPGVGIGAVAGRFPVHNKKRVETVLDELDQVACRDFWMIEVAPRNVSCFRRRGEQKSVEWHISDSLDFESMLD
ncbi:MAG: hypothetical protein ACXAEN_11930 [Candidatus Thorarchaeota archaeon]|jgi:hypothetical protein